MPTSIAFAADARDFGDRTLPLLLAARELGLDAALVTNGRGHEEVAERVGARLIAVGANLHSVNPATAGYAAGQVAGALRAVRPDLVHAVGLGPCLIGGAACAMARVERRIYSVGPLGGLALTDDRLAWLGRRVVTSLLKGPLRTAATRVVFENEADPALFGLEDGTAVIMPGTGVDPERLRLSPMPASPPLRIALAAPLTWGNGVDAAVEAVRLARGQGADVELSLFPEPSNARLGRFRGQVLSDWAQAPGVSVHGPAGDQPGIWQAHHVACLPARGGVGVSGFLLQAAARGRPLVVTDIPGSRDLVTDGSEGFCVPPDDPAALADAFSKLAADPVLLPRMGAAARARVLHGYLKRDLIEAAKGLYASLLDRVA